MSMRDRRMGVVIGRMARWKIAGTAGVACALVALSCGGGGGGGTCSPSTDISGNWSGPATGDTIARGNPGVINATFVQVGCEVIGAWAFDFQDTHLDITRDVAGSPPETNKVSLKFGNTVESCDQSLGFCQTVNGCIYDVEGTLVSPTEIVGTYATGQNCSQSQNGSFDIKLVSPFVPAPTPTPFAFIDVPAATPTP
jgi:hypothetical protein